MNTAKDDYLNACENLEDCLQNIAENEDDLNDLDDSDWEGISTIEQILEDLYDDELEFRNTIESYEAGNKD